MKRAERDKAIVLRKGGVSMREIARTLNVSKASVSFWVRDIPLTSAQRQRLTLNGYSVDAVEKRRQRRLENTRLQRVAIMQEAAKNLGTLSDRALWLIGIALYWGEGGKTKTAVRLSNSDPGVIKVMMKFFRIICDVPEEKFRGHVHTFSHLNVESAERYWSKISNIPRRQFYKTYSKPSIASKNKRNTLPYGTFQIYVHDTRLYFKMMGWIERMKKV